ncbi:hypothetical protein ADK55_12895, partial [Streptomyces sp. WM4235]|uniref:hypothetical protein n=1 Tax=Streptomyces sp. WM4235 TaxID=1415551 RepID=UPI0006C002BE
ERSGEFLGATGPSRVDRVLGRAGVTAETQLLRLAVRGWLAMAEEVALEATEEAVAAEPPPVAGGVIGAASIYRALLDSGLASMRGIA